MHKQTRSSEHARFRLESGLRHVLAAALVGLMMSACGGGGSGGDSGAATPGTDAGTRPADGTNATARPGGVSDADFAAEGYGGGLHRLAFQSPESRKLLNVIDLVGSTSTTFFDSEPSLGPSSEAEIVRGVSSSGRGRLAVVSRSDRFDRDYAMTIFDTAGAAQTRFRFQGFVQTGPALNPDGDRVALVDQQGGGFSASEWSVQLFSIPEGTQKKVHALRTSTNATEAAATALAWAPTGELLVLTTNELIRFDKNGNLLSSQAVGPLSAPSCGAVSPDGKTIWFNQSVGNKYGSAVWSMDLATLQVRRRIHDDTVFGVECPTLSPDGRFVYVNLGNAFTDGYVYSTSYQAGIFRVMDEEIDGAGVAKYILGPDRKAIPTNGTQLAAF